MHVQGFGGIEVPPQPGFFGKEEQPGYVPPPSYGDIYAKALKENYDAAVSMRMPAIPLQGANTSLYVVGGIAASGIMILLARRR